MKMTILLLASFLFAGYSRLVAGDSPAPWEAFDAIRRDGLDSSLSRSGLTRSGSGCLWLPTMYGCLQDARRYPLMLAEPNDGGLVLTGGRPGNPAWFHRVGSGQDRIHGDLSGHHNKHQSADAFNAGDTTTS